MFWFVFGCFRLVWQLLWSSFKWLVRNICRCVCCPCTVLWTRFGCSAPDEGCHVEGRLSPSPKSTGRRGPAGLPPVPTARGDIVSQPTLSVPVVHHTYVDLDHGDQSHYVEMGPVSRTSGQAVHNPCYGSGTAVRYGPVCSRSLVIAFFFLSFSQSHVGIYIYKISLNNNYIVSCYTIFWHFLLSTPFLYLRSGRS